MKKIGILFGQEHSFPPAFVERVNQKTGGKDIVAEFVRIDKVIQGEPCGYDVVIDRISHLKWTTWKSSPSMRRQKVIRYRMGRIQLATVKSHSSTRPKATRLN